MEEVKKRGGKREGAGRKPLEVPREKFITYVSSLEQFAIKSFINSMRNESGAQESNLNIVDNNQKVLEKLKTNYDNDISVLESKYDSRIQELTDEIKVLQSSLKYYKSEIALINEKHENEIHAQKSNYQNDIKKIRLKYENEINALKSEHQNEISILSADIDYYSNELDVQKSNNSQTEINAPKSKNKVNLDELLKLHQSGLTYNQVADKLNESGSLTATGKAWTKKSVEHQMVKAKKSIVK